MDIVPVIRCIYRARDDRLGKKLVLYVDRHGELDVGDVQPFFNSTPIT
jgi:hypothetical protein